jgi:trehalose 6-phosphate synthase
MRSQALGLARERLAPQLGDLNIVRVDRVDPSKNQLVGFKAFARLLDMRPDLRSRVRFSAFLIPSRTDLKIYRAYKDVLYELVDEINDRFAGECGRPPIQIYYVNDRDQALAGLESCDVLLVNSLQDGMNLVAKEWALVSRRPGVLVLSETAGVAGEAEDSAILVRPHDVEGTASALAAALAMPASEREERIERFRSRIRIWTARHWLGSQLMDLGLGDGAATYSQSGPGYRRTTIGLPPEPASNPVA